MRKHLIYLLAVAGDSCIVQQITVLCATFAVMRKFSKKLPIVLNESVFDILWESRGKIRKWKVYRRVIYYYFGVYLVLNIIRYLLMARKKNFECLSTLRKILFSYLLLFKNATAEADLERNKDTKFKYKKVSNTVIISAIVIIIYYYLKIDVGSVIGEDAIPSIPADTVPPSNFSFDSVSGQSTDKGGCSSNTAAKFPWRDPDYKSWKDRGPVSWRDIIEVSKESFNNFKISNNKGS